MPTCPSCTGEVADGTNFCPSCGAALHSPAVAAMIQDSQRALTSNPDDAAARYNLAIAYRIGGMDDLALEELTRVAELQPDFPDVYYELGALHAKYGRCDDAIAALKRACELNPDDHRAGKLLARLEST